MKKCEKTWICIEKDTLNAVDAVHRVADDGDGGQVLEIRCFEGDSLIDDVDDGLKFCYIVVMDLGKKEGCSDDFPIVGAANE